jgi:predicted dehydrogenase
MSSFSRREFMRRGTAGAAGIGLLLNGKPVRLEANPLPPPAGPNDRINLGFVGFGIRGNILMEAIKKTGQANLVAVCDCYQGHLTRAKERTEGKIDTVFAQYKALLDRKDIDAVILAPPDHQHLPMVMDALAAGKDVYIEKPMTHRIEEGPKIIEAVKRYNRVLQVGSQGRSSSLQKKAREIVASGQLGKVSKIIASYNRNSSNGAWNYPVPPDLKEGVNFNWQEWLGNAPKCPYDPERVFRYRKFWDYSGGISTDLFVHLITSIHFIMDAKIPSSVMASGGVLVRKDGREVPDTLDALFVYPEEFNVNMGATFNNASVPDQGMTFLGNKGSLTLFGGAFTVAPENTKEGYGYAIDSWPKDLQDVYMNTGSHRVEANPPIIEEGVVTYKDQGTDSVVLHTLEFLESVRSRKECSENAVIGHHAAAAGHMVNLSYLSGKRMVWDAAADTAREA